MTDQEILSKLGVQEHEAQAKIRQAIDAPAYVPGATPDAAEAAAALGGNCTAADVERFVSARANKAPGTALIYFGPVGDTD